jgi:putative hydrolase of the HAD superfamily
MLILFDIDDTLLDHGRAERAAAGRLHGRIGSVEPLDDFLAKWSAALERHYPRYLAGEVSLIEQRRGRLRETVDRNLTDAAADGLYLEYFADYEQTWSLFSDVLPCLDRLAGHRLGVISNGQVEQQRRKLSQTGILDRFQLIVVSEQFGRAKPDPAIFRHACEAAGVRPAEAIYVGDRYDVDAQAARAAGLHGIWLDRRAASGTDHLPPIITSLEKLLVE